MITKKNLQNAIDFWERECQNIMDSQKKYNEEALALSKHAFEDWMRDLDNVHSI